MKLSPRSNIRHITNTYYKGSYRFAGDVFSRIVEIRDIPGQKEKASRAGSWDLLDSSTCLDSSLFGFLLHNGFLLFLGFLLSAVSFLLQRTLRGDSS